MVTTTSAAPGALEDLRSLVNSWRIPNDTRQAADELADRAGDPRSWGEHHATIPRPNPGQVDELREFRDALREMLGGHGSARIDRFVRATPTALSVEGGVLGAAPHDERDPVAVATALLLRAAVDRTLTRLRTCPDCGWAFYDSSRNGKRVWCAMVSAVEGGRGCGSAAKTRAYRRRRRVTPGAGTPDAPSSG